MQVLPINLNIIPKFKSSPYNISYQGLIYTEKPDSFVCSFTGNDEKATDKYSQIKSLDLSPALHCKNIHCPSCGVQMLTQEEFDDIEKQLNSVTNAHDVISILKKNKNSIPINMRKIISTIKSDDSTSMSVKDFYRKHHDIALIDLKHNLNDVKNYLLSISASYPDDIKKNFSTFVSKIDDYKNFYDYRSDAINLLSSFDVDPYIKNDMYNNTLNVVKEKKYYLDIFDKMDQLDNMSEQDVAKSLIDNLYKNSISKIVQINRYDVPYELKNNDIIVCSECANRNKKSKVFMDFKNIDDPYNVKDNLRTYLNGISMLMGKGQLDDNGFYITNLLYIADKFSNGTLKFNETERKSLGSIKKLSKRHEEFGPIIQTEHPVPCACCGGIMLPHKVRQEIHKDLMQASNPLQYANVIKKYQIYITPNTKKLARDFLEIVESHPKISNEDFVKLYGKRADSRSKNSVNQMFKLFEKNKNNVKTYCTERQAKCLDDFEKNLKTYIYSGKFKDYMYEHLSDYIFNNKECPLDKEVATYPIYFAMTTLKRISYINTLSSVRDCDRKTDDNPVYTLVYNIFKSSVGTADHLMPADKDGKGSIDNLIGLCRACNFLKGAKIPAFWFSQFYTVKENFLKQLLVIDNMSKDGELEGFEGWAKNMAEQMYEYTNGRYDIREFFDENE